MKSFIHRSNEWAFKPKDKWTHYELILVSTDGVVLDEHTIKRGEIYDFDIKRPPLPPRNMMQFNPYSSVDSKTNSKQTSKQSKEQTSNNNSDEMVDVQEEGWNNAIYKEGEVN